MAYPPVLRKAGAAGLEAEIFKSKKTLVALRRLEGHYSAWERPQVDKTGKVFAEPENILETATDSIGTAVAKVQDGITDMFQQP